MNQRSSQLALPRARFWQVSLLVALVLTTGLWLMVTTAAQAQESETQAQEESETSEESPPGYLYTVQEGDSWETVAQRTGVTVEQLQEANPDAVRDSGWLIVGEELFVPTSTPEQNQIHVVSAGESWASIAAQYGIPVSLLRAANPGSIRSGAVLYAGEQLTVPPIGAVVPTAVPTPVPRLRPVTGATATPTPTVTVTATTTETAAPDAGAAEETTEEPVAEATEEATEEPTAEPTAAPTAEPTEEPTEEPEAEPTAAPEAEATPAAQEEITATEELTATAPVTSGEAVTETDALTATEALTAAEEITGSEATTDTASGLALPACPEAFADYPEMMADVINRNEEAIDAVVAFLEGCEALVEEGSAVGDLTNDDLDDLVVVYQNPSQEQLFVEGDLVIFNNSPDGLVLSYRARAAGEVRLLATGDINADELPDVVWVDTTCGASTCFDTVNVRSWDGATWADWTDGTVTMAYAEIELEDRSEDGTGQEIVLSGGIYGSVGAGPQRSRTETWASLGGMPYVLLEKAYSESECLYHTVIDANRAFLEAPTNGFDAAQLLYQQAVDNQDLIKCWVRNDELAELRSFSLFRLALIAGYQGDAEGAAAQIAALSEAYPGSIYDEVGQQWLAAYEAAGDAAAACTEVTAFVEENPLAWEMLADYGYTNPSFEAADVCPVLEIGGEAGDAAGEEDANEQGEESSTSPPTSAVEGEPVASEAVEGEAVTVTASLACPADLAGYAEALPPLLAEAAGDPAPVERWLRGCDALADDRGAVVLAELNDDGLPDAIVYPTLITDLGYGPDGAQGAVLIYHTAEDGSHLLVANPEIYGQPDPLAVDDFNADGRTDIAWTVTACSTFCVLEAQVWTWDGDAYLSLIEPGAAIAEGSARFTPLPEGAPGDGQQLLLEGGVSGTPEGGLAVPHTESWQSMDGGRYRRIAWSYDRTVEGHDCLGLRLVEADMALHASDVVGYGPAIELYTAALDPELRACSILGLAESQELDLLQGLAAFRLIQAQGLSGDVGAALDTLEILADYQPDGAYTEAAIQWLEAMQTGQDPASACIAVGALFADHPELWQITDHFGYNHPALAAGQVCYTP